MSVSIRMSRHGAKKKPFYRIVVSDQALSPATAAISSRSAPTIRRQDRRREIDQEKIAAWIKKGAKPSPTVSELIKKEAKAS
jgi:small subunit ribosomal protein S16